MATQMPNPSRIGGLGEKVENTLIRFLTRWLDAVKGVLSDVIGFGIGVILDAVEDSIADKAGPILTEIQGTPGLPSWLKSYLAELQHPTDQGTAIGLSGLSMGVASGASSALLGPVFRKINYAMDRSMMTARFDPQVNFAARWRFPEHLGALQDALHDLGYGPDSEAILPEILRPRLSSAEQVQAAWLTKESTADAVAEMQKRGYSPEDADRLLELLKLRPGPSDLVRMGVREAWNDGVASKWGYDIDFPGAFGEEMKRAGDTEDWAQKYWRAHWELPGLGSVLEMLHRGVVTEVEFSEYLRIADYPDGWRERIAQVAYTPYTRVDTRRMYRFGVLDDVGVYNTYRDIGYDHEHATAMTQFTVLDALEEERELTKTDVLRGYRLARFTQAEAQANLVALGYNATVAAMLLSNEDQAEEESKISGVVSNTHSLYIRGGISRSEVITRLAVYNLASSEIDRYFELWDLEKESRVALPTRSALDGFLSDDIITVAEYEAGLAALSYTVESIAWYTQAVLLDKQAKAEKERERATNEAEQVAKREIATDYQRAKAALTVDLREVEARIGELQNAIQARTLQYQADTALAKKRVSVDQLTGEYDTGRAQVHEVIDTYAIETREYREEIEALQTQIAVLLVELEDVVDESLTEAARLQIAQLQVHKEEIQTILSEGRAEIAVLEAEIHELVDPTFTEELRGQIADYQVMIEAVQDVIASLRLDQAEITRQLLDVPVDQVPLLKAEYLDLAVSIAERLVTIDEAQTEIAGLREASIDPELAGDLHSRQGLIEEIRANNSQAAVFLQEIDQSVVTIRLEQIDPERVAQTQGLRREILETRVQIDQYQDVIAADSTAIAEAQAALGRLSEGYKRGLRDLQRVGSLEAVEASYRADIGALQAELGQARDSKNGLRVQLAEVQYEYTT